MAPVDTYWWTSDDQWFQISLISVVVYTYFSYQMVNLAIKLGHSILEYLLSNIRSWQYSIVVIIYMI